MSGLVPNEFTLFLDISGKITEAVVGAEYLTTAAISLLPESLEHARAALPSGFPKWRDAELSDALRALELIRSMALAAVTLRTLKEPVAWGRFWADAKSYHAKMAQATKGAGSFTKAANVIKYWQFGECEARCLGETLKRVGKPTIVDANGLHAASATVVCDSDIQGAENIEMFEYLWKVAEKKQALLATVQLAAYTRSAQLETEQQEPLLLLADHLAGAVQACTSRQSVNPPPKISSSDLDEIQKAYESLPCLDRREGVFDIPYTEIFGNSKIGQLLWSAV